MAERREYAGASVETTLSGSIIDSSTSIGIASASGWPTGSVGPWFVVIDEGQSTEEHVKILSRSGTTLTVATSGRGADGTSAVGHALGATIRCVFTANDADLLNKHAADVTQDDHTQYVSNSVARSISAEHDFTGDPTFSGDPDFTGNPVFSGDPHFTGEPVIDNMGTLGDLNTVIVGTASAGTSNRPMRADAQLVLDEDDVMGIRWSTGEVKMILGSGGAPQGGVELLGQTLSKITYAGTWADYQGVAAISLNSTQFQLVDGRGLSLVGAGAGGDYAVGEIYGSDTHEMTEAEMPEHDHSFTGTAHNHTASSPEHDHGIPRAASGTFSAGATNYVPNNSGGADQSDTFATAVSVTVNNATAGGTVGNAGSGDAFSVIQRSIGVRLFVRLY